ncbi:hypothetical protein K458DRAFT_392221 [Lentithecium fluviatile CBS 122367]|uniref:Uncharacterized protein n=1 Tax=Lentithecium fluviatile CBS 122367 TaxID=1168545 RepID=A0A6G1IRW9_9PLEO|nr:hypothetical protein K458DRAFT_392221 [Lentithecium fluviatile CBS 122367]
MDGKLPREAIDEMMWPIFFPAGERNEIKGYVRGHLDKDEALWNEDLLGEDLSAVILATKNSEDFSIDDARSASTIQAVVKELRNYKHGHARRNASRLSTASRFSQSTIEPTKKGPFLTKKGKRTRKEETDEEEDEDSVNPAKRCRETTRGRSRKRSSAGRTETPTQIQAIESIETDDSQPT